MRKLSSGYYQIIAGERRWRAARMAGLQEVPVIVIEADDRKAAELAMIENLQREDLNPMEEAAGFQSLIDNYHLTQEEAARRVGKSRSAVTNSLRLLGLTPSVRTLVEGQLLRRTCPGASAPLPCAPRERRRSGGGRRVVRPADGRPAKRLAEARNPRPSHDPLRPRLCRRAQKALSSKLGRGVKSSTAGKKAASNWNTTEWMI